MRSINTPNQYPNPHNHQHQQPQTAAMVLVQTPQGYGWVPQRAMGQTAPTAPNVQGIGQPAATSAFTTLLILGGLGLVGYWAYNKWGKEGRKYAGEDRGYVRSRRKRRSRSRLMSEFKHFLDEGNGGVEEAEEPTHEAEEDSYESDEEY